MTDYSPTYAGKSAMTALESIAEEIDDLADSTETLYGQIFDLKALLGLFCAFMESDIEAGKVSEKSIRRHYLAEARQIVPRPKSE
jgi:hypothetical protein